MDAIKMLRHQKYWIGRGVRREEGSSIIELAIIFPILLIMFVGNVVNGNVQDIIDEKTKTRNLVVCGIPSIVATACTNQTPIVLGLSTANVTICDNFSVPCNPVIPTGSIKYFRVEITNYNYGPGVWNLAAMTGLANGTFYGNALKPSTEMRYVP